MREDVPLPAVIVESSDVTPAAALMKKHKNVLLVDHEDSFVHTLANYLRQTGATNLLKCYTILFGSAVHILQ